MFKMTEKPALSPVIQYNKKPPHLKQEMRDYPTSQLSIS
jgi:hypothetical protein